MSNITIAIFLSEGRVRARPIEIPGQPPAQTKSLLMSQTDITKTHASKVSEGHRRWLSSHCRPAGNSGAGGES
jgi:hypothetical protein